MIFVIILFVYFVLVNPLSRCLVCQAYNTVRYAIRDCYMYLRHRMWYNLQTGRIICYTALFGQGKTLSVVHYIVGIYRYYHNRIIWDPVSRRLVRQVVHVISNVDLTIPFERFESLLQVVQAADRFKKLDQEQGTLTCILVLGDEFSVQLNSRQFKSNIDPMFLNTLLTCRHHHISIIYNAQRFNHVDALLRQVTSYVVHCQKVWRVVILRKYDAWDLENAKDILHLKPLSVSSWFATDKDFDQYDTLACVGNLEKSCLGHDMISETEILALQSQTAPDYSNIHNLDSRSKEFYKRVRDSHVRS